jgi:glycosyltransferase involved in cell wall biosynthesis
VPVGNAEAIALAVNELLGDKQKRRAIGEAASESIRNEFSLERMVDDTEAIYRKAKNS